MTGQLVGGIVLFVLSLSVGIAYLFSQLKERRIDRVANAYLDAPEMGCSDGAAALYKSGAFNLQSLAELREVCDRIVACGRSDPRLSTIISERHLLRYLKYCRSSKLKLDTAPEEALKAWAYKVASL